MISTPKTQCRRRARRSADSGNGGTRSTSEAQSSTPSALQKAAGLGWAYRDARDNPGAGGTNVAATRGDRPGHHLTVRLYRRPRERRIVSYALSASQVHAPIDVFPNTLFFS